MTHWKRPWCWEGLGAGGEGDDRGWDGRMASPTRWAWVWVNSGIWWWTGRPGVVWFMGLQRVGHDWATELNWERWKRAMKTSHDLKEKSVQGNPLGFQSHKVCSSCNPYNSADPESWKSNPTFTKSELHVRGFVRKMLREIRRETIRPLSFFY